MAARDTLTIAGFAGAAGNVENPAAPAPAANDFWTCSSLSGNPCPNNPALGSAPSPAHLSFPVSSFTGAIDTWILTFQVTAANDNYSGGSQAFATVSFTTTTSGG